MTIKYKKIRPMFTGVITTANEVEVNLPSGLIDVTKTKQGVSEVQEVIAVGSAVKDFKVGDMVCINFKRFMKQKYSQNSLKNDVEEYNPTISYNIPIIELDGKDALMIDNQDIAFVIEDYEEVEDTPESSIETLDPSTLILPNNQIIS